MAIRPNGAPRSTIGSWDRDRSVSSPLKRGFSLTELLKLSSMIYRRKPLYLRMP